MNDFFKRKNIVKPPYGEFDLTKESDLESCGLESNGKSFNSRNASFFKTLESAANMESTDNPVGQVAKQLEEHFSVREMSFLLAKTMLVKGLRDRAETNKRAGLGDQMRQAGAARAAASNGIQNSKNKYINGK